MPDARLERTRNPQPTVAPCQRLGHLYRVIDVPDVHECLRCRRQITRRDLWRVVDMIRHGRGEVSW